MHWFRMYGEMPNDPKIGTLNDAQFRTWVELLCMACNAEKDGSTGLTIETINWSLRRNATETLQKLIETKLVYIDEKKEIVISAWDKRQYASDSSTARVQAFRERQKNQSLKSETPTETLPEHFSNGLEQNRTEQIQNRTDKKKHSASCVGVDVLVLHGVDEQVAKDWLALRKQKKSTLTETAFAGILRESRKAAMSLADVIRMCCERGWIGFKAEWVERSSPRLFESLKDKSRRETNEALTGKKQYDDHRTIDI